MADTTTGAGLDSFDPAKRRAALESLVAGRGHPAPPGENVNLHFHSFYSYNAEGWSPSHIAWESSRRGLYAAGLCDFDVLDGLEEFAAACRLVALRGCVHIETRTYASAFRDVDVNSPGEHGVAYVMGGGFARVPEAGSAAAFGLERFRSTARERNLALLERMNAAVPEVRLDYVRDVLPLTPAGVATERHIVRAFVDSSLSTRAGDEAERFYAGLLRKDREGARRLLADRAALEEAVRSRLVKRGGLAYREPNEGTFPPLAEFCSWVSSCGALPMAAWLDGTSGGEAKADRFLDVMAEAGACTLNIIPDRNWNLRESAERERKVAKLREVVAAALRRAFPLNIGTEMNRAGLPFADELSGPVLKEFREPFIEGARVLVGHAILLRFAGMSYAGARARTEIGEDPARRNAFFGSVGALPPVTDPLAGRLSAAGEERALAMIRDAARAGRWNV